MAKMQQENVVALRRTNRFKAALKCSIVILPFTPKKKAIVSMQRLTPLQRKEQRDGGLCYNYDEKWGSGHKCKLTCLLIMEFVDSNEEKEAASYPMHLER